ncbi:MAG: hypothetical protein DRQ39_10740, partial [Gammaproteobacteria bacterium]
DAIIKERYPDPKDSGELAEKALQQIHKDNTARFINVELRALTGGKSSPLKVIKEAARRTVESIPLYRLRPDKYLANERKYSRMAYKAKAAGKIDEAIDAKRKQLVNHQMHREATKTKEAFEKKRKRMQRLSKKTYQDRMSDAGPEYRDGVNAILDSVDLANISGLAAQRRELVRIANENILKANVNEQATYEIDEIIVPPKSYKAMTLTEFTVYANKAEELYNEARGKNTIVIDGQRVDFEPLEDELVATAYENAGKKKSHAKLTTEITDSPKKWIEMADAAHTKIEFVLKQLDGNTEGVWWRTFMPQLQAADNLRSEMLEDYGTRMNDVLSPIAENFKHKLNTSTGKVADRSQVFMMALNMGNEDSITKLFEGMEQHGWSKSELLELTNQLSEAEWNAVQGVLDVVNSLWPQIAAIEEKRTGYAPEKVQAQTINTPFGSIKGGYFPLAYDKQVEYTAHKNDDATKLRELNNNLGARASTRKGHTKSRVKNVKLKIDFSLSVIDAHITQVVQDLAFDSPTRELNKILSSQKIMNAVSASVGMEKAGLFSPWLVEVARGDYTSRVLNERVSGVLGALRRNTTVVAMGYKLTTMLVQPLGIAQSIQQLGMGVLAEMMMNPLSYKSNRQMVLGKSKMMKHRAANIDRDIRDTLNKIDHLNANKVVQANNIAKQYAFIGIVEMDLLVTVPTWKYAYEQSISMGMTEDQAIAFADGKVRQTQGHGAIKDLSSIQRGNEVTRLMTMFYMYFSSFYNMMGEAARQTKGAWSEGRKLDAILGATRAYLLLVAVPAVLSELMMGRGPEDDEDFMEWAVKEMVAYPAYSVIVLRDAVNYISSGYSYKITPIEGAVTAIAKGVKEASQGEFDKTGVQAIGYATGSPFFSTEAWIMYNNLTAWANGEDLEPVEMLMIKEAKD